MIKFRNVTKIYPPEVAVLQDVSFEIKEGEFVSIVGKSGAGKTTLVRLILGLETPTSGEVYFKDLDPNAVQVELFANATKDKGLFRQEMKRINRLAGTEVGYVYSLEAPVNRPANDYTTRLIPRCNGVEVPLEEEQILWQR